MPVKFYNAYNNNEFTELKTLVDGKIEQGGNPYTDIKTEIMAKLCERIKVATYYIFVMSLYENNRDSVKRQDAINIY